MIDGEGDVNDDIAKAVAWLSERDYADLAAVDPAAAGRALRSAQTMTQRLAGMGIPGTEPAAVYRPVGADGERRDD